MTKNYSKKVVLASIDALLKIMVDEKASDLFITQGMPPSLKINGIVTPLSDVPLNSDQVETLVFSVMSPERAHEFHDMLEANFAVHRADLGRFRINVFQQQNEIGMVIRRIELQIPTLEELHLPHQLEELAMVKRGLVLVVGATGAGKSSTLAALIGHRNENSHGHIVCIEEPIEFLHKHRNCIVTQREVGIDTHSYESALKNTLRQAPDVIMVGEIRSREAMEHAIAFAETGHLVLSTLHASNSYQALDRIINFFPDERRSQLLMDLSLHLNAIVAQRLIPSRKDNTRRVAAEIMINSPLVSALILRGETHLLRDVMKKSGQQGMKTFDQRVFELYKAGEISRDDAILHADSPNEVRLMIKLNGEVQPCDLNTAMQDVTFDNSGTEEDSGVLQHTNAPQLIAHPRKK